MMKGLEFIEIFGLGLLALSSVKSLNLQQVEEGSCAGVRNITQGSLNMNWFNTPRNWYIVAGNKHHPYAVTLHHYGGNEEIFEAIPEYQFYYEACLQVEMNGSNISTNRGFEPGRMSLNRMSEVGPGVIDFIHERDDDDGEVDISRHVITLTDNESFVFSANCNLLTDQKGWDILSTVPELSPSARKSIEEHAIAQGFDRENFAFMRYDSCQPGVVPNNANMPGGRGGMSRMQRRGSPKGNVHRASSRGGWNMN